MSDWPRRSPIADHLLRTPRRSDAYDENTFVLTRAFVKRACANPHPHLTRELEAFYFDGLGPAGVPALKTVIEQVRALVAESERQAGRAVAVGVGGVPLSARSAVVPELMVLTAGAAATLRGTLVGLEAVARGKGKAW